MADEGDNHFMRYIYRGEEDEIEFISREATHIIVHEDVTVILAETFSRHPNIVEVICHDKVEKIEGCAFEYCPSLRRVIMPGVKVVEERVFWGCKALTEVECGKLEIVGGWAFSRCHILTSINLPSARIVEEGAFSSDRALAVVKFGSKLERIGVCAFTNCKSLERITIPLKDNLIAHDGNTFTGCCNLKHVDLVEGELHESVAALQLEEWRNDMNDEIESINRILPDASAGCYNYFGDEEDGEKAQVTRRWIRSILQKIRRYQEEHRRLLDEVETTLQHDVDLVEGELQETIAALQLEIWRNDMNEEIDSINQILPNTPAGYYNYEGDQDDGEKARAIRRWIKSVLSKIIHYQGEHQRILNEEVATALKLVLSDDIVMNNVLPFLELPPHTFEVEVDEDEEEHDSSYSEGEVSEREEDNSDDEEERHDDDDDDA